MDMLWMVVQQVRWCSVCFVVGRNGPGRRGCVGRSRDWALKETEGEWMGAMSWAEEECMRAGVIGHWVTILACRAWHPRMRCRAGWVV